LQRKLTALLGPYLTKKKLEFNTKQDLLECSLDSRIKLGFSSIIKKIKENPCAESILRFPEDFEHVLLSLGSHCKRVCLKNKLQRIKCSSDKVSISFEKYLVL